MNVLKHSFFDYIKDWAKFFNHNKLRFIKQIFLINFFILSIKKSENVTQLYPHTKLMMSNKFQKWWLYFNFKFKTTNPPYIAKRPKMIDDFLPWTFNTFMLILDSERCEWSIGLTVMLFFFIWLYHFVTRYVRISTPPAKMVFTQFFKIFQFSGFNIVNHHSNNVFQLLYNLFHNIFGWYVYKIVYVGYWKLCSITWWHYLKTAKNRVKTIFAGGIDSVFLLCV